MLTIHDLHVSIGSKPILRGLTLAKPVEEVRAATGSRVEPEENRSAVALERVTGG